MKKNIIYILSTFFLGLNLSLCIGALANNQRVTDHKTIPQNINNSWSGKYRQVKGAHDLIIEEVDSDMVAVEIVLIKSSGSRPTSTFLAVTKGNTASMKLLHDDPECRVELRRDARGISLSDFCGGTGEDTGLYKRIQ